jgi:hypothetical protein
VAVPPGLFSIQRNVASVPLQHNQFQLPYNQNQTLEEEEEEAACAVGGGQDERPVAVGGEGTS